MKPIVHYILDPLCGWCYAAEPLARHMADVKRDQIELRLHGGRLIEGPTLLPAGMRSHIREAVGRVSQLSGQTFGQPFLQDLLDRQDALWDSLPAIRAVMAVSQRDGFIGLRLLSELQRLHFVEGHLLDDPEVFAFAAERVGVPRAEFLDAYQGMTEAHLQAHVEESRELLRRVGGVGFPTFAMERGAQFITLTHAQHYGQPGRFVEQIDQLLQLAPSKPVDNSALRAALPSGV